MSRRSRRKTTKREHEVEHEEEEEEMMGRNGPWQVRMHGGSTHVAHWLYQQFVSNELNKLMMQASSSTIHNFVCEGKREKVEKGAWHTASAARKISRDEK